MGYYNVPVDNIRGETITYQQAIIKIIIKLDNELQGAISKWSWQQFRGIEGQVRFLNACVAPYYDKGYRAEVDAIKEKLEAKTPYNRELRWEHFTLLMDWMQLIVERFGRFGILPAIEEDFVSGEGPLNAYTPDNAAAD